MQHCTEKIWHQFSQQLKFFIKKRVKEDEDVEDILQEVFIKIHKNIDQLESQKNIKAWLYTITRNTIIDFYRQSKNVEILDKEALENLPNTLEKNNQELIGEFCKCLEVFLENLPEKYKEALTYTDYAGNSQKELAVRLGISASGAKSRVQRGRRLMKAMFLGCCVVEKDARKNVTSYVRREDSKKCDC